MNITQSDFWFFRKIMSTRENLLIVLLLAFLIPIFVLAELSQVFVALSASIGLSCAQIVRRLQHNVQFALLPNYVIKLSLIISVVFLLLALIIFIPFPLRNPDVNSLKLFIFVYSASLFIGFFPLVYLSFAATLPVIIFAEIFNFELISNLIISTIEEAYYHPYASGLIVLSSLSLYTLGVLKRIPFGDSHVQSGRPNWISFNFQTSGSLQFNRKDREQIYRTTNINLLFGGLLLFIIYQEETLPFLIYTENSILFTFFPLYYVSLSTSVIGFSLPTNIDRLWLASASKNRQSFLFRNSLVKQGVANIALGIAYGYSALTRNDYAPAILWFFILQIFLQSVANTPMRKRTAIPLSICSTIALLFASNSAPASLTIAVLIWASSLLYFATGKGLPNGRLRGACLGHDS